MAKTEVVGESRRGSWLWIPVGLVLAALKARAFADVVGHRGGAIALLGVWLAIALLKMRLASVAITSAALFGILISAHSIARGLAFGGAAFLTLMGVFLLIATVLLARQDS